MKLRTFLIVSLLLLSACSGGSEQSDDSTITGIVTEVKSSGLNEVSSFTIKDGDRIEKILIDESVNYGFPLGHLEEHRIGASPLEVEVEERDGKLYAISMVDVEG